MSCPVPSPLETIALVDSRMGRWNKDVKEAINRSLEELHKKKCQAIRNAHFRDFQSMREATDGKIPALQEQMLQRGAELSALGNGHNLIKKEQDHEGLKEMLQRLLDDLFDIIQPLQDTMVHELNLEDDRRDVSMTPGPRPDPGHDELELGDDQLDPESDPEPAPRRSQRKRPRLKANVESNSNTKTTSRRSQRKRPASMSVPATKSAKRPRRGGQEEDPYTDNRGIDFDKVYQDGNAAIKHKIAEYPLRSGHFYIAECKEHSIHLTKDVIHGAAKHLDVHGEQRYHGNAVRLLCTRVRNCNSALSEMNNKVAKEAFSKGLGHPPRQPQSKKSKKQHHQNKKSGKRLSNPRQAINPEPGHIYAALRRRNSAYYPAMKTAGLGPWGESTPSFTWTSSTSQGRLRQVGFVSRT
ncbi:hypothetical protein ACJ41O_012728 [Fusarium nematophilum]